MFVSVRGHKDWSLKRELQNAANFYAEILMSTRLLHNLDIEVRLTQNLEDKGYCSEVGKKEYLIEILIEDKEEMLTTLAHEMVHASQLARRLLVPTKKYNVCKWKKEFYRTDNVDYNTLPWEIQARDLEDELYRKYMEHVNGSLRTS